MFLKTYQHLNLDLQQAFVFPNQTAMSKGMDSGIERPCKLVNVDFSTCNFKTNTFTGTESCLGRKKYSPKTNFITRNIPLENTAIFLSVM